MGHLKRSQHRFNMVDHKFLLIEINKMKGKSYPACLGVLLERV